MLAGIAFSLVSTTVNNLLGIRKRTKEIQDEMQKWQNDFKVASEKNDEKALKRLKEKEAQVMPMMQEMMLLPWKSMVVVLPMFFFMTGDPWFTHYPGIILQTFSKFLITLPFDLHLSAVFSLGVFNPAVYGPKGFFIVCVLFAGIVTSIAEQQIEKLFKTKK